MSAKKYTKETLEEAVRTSKTWGDVCRKFGATKVHGGSRSYVKSKADAFGIDYSHFLGRAWIRGTDRKWERREKRTADQILINRSDGVREHGYMLRRALIESGTKYACFICGLTEWLDSQITLDVDHIDGDCLNDSRENLRFLCPNCHSQTPTFKNKKR
jgi:hypothetical protein